LANKDQLLKEMTSFALSKKKKINWKMKYFVIKIQWNQVLETTIIVKWNVNLQIIVNKVVKSVLKDKINGKVNKDIKNNNFNNFSIPTYPKDIIHINSTISIWRDSDNSNLYQLIQRDFL